MITKLTDQRVSFDNGDVVLSYQSPRQTRFPKLHEVDLTGLVSPVRLKLPNHMVNTPDLPTPCKCSEIPWHPYPEEIPEEMGKFYECTLKDVNKTYDMLWQDFKWMNDDGQHIPSVIAFTEKRPPYIQPPKKKTVRVSQKAIISAIEGYFFQFDKKAHLTIYDLPDFIEIEVEE